MPVDSIQSISEIATGTVLSPDLTTIFIETIEPSHPFGVKAVAEIPMDGVAPAVSNAILDACGAQIDICPATPERIWKAIHV